MVDLFYNEMMENLVLKLYKFIPIYEKETMDQYETVGLKEWNGIKETIDSIKDYIPENGRANNLMKYYNNTLYPLWISGKIVKSGFKKNYAFKINDGDFREMLRRVDGLMKLDY